MLTNLANYLTTTIKYIIVAVVSFLLGYGCYAILHSTTANTESELPTEANKEPVEVHEISKVTLREKQKTSDPDLVVNNRYIAEIHGQTFEIPKSPSVTARGSSTHEGSKGLQTTITSDINMTPVVRKMADLEYKRNWEVSTGLGRSHDGHFYVPIGLQRNYNYDRAIEVSIGLSKDHVENFQVVHKWKF